MVMSPKSGNLALLDGNAQSAVRRLNDNSNETLDKLISEVTSNKYEQLINEIATILWQLLPNPMESATSMDMWKNSKFAKITCTNDVFKQAVVKVEDMFQSTNILDWFEHLRECEPILNIRANYMSPKKSARIIKNWLVFQFGEGDYLNVLNTIYKVLSYLLYI